MRGGAECDVVVEAAPAAALEVVEPDLLLELLVVAFDPPAELGEADELDDGTLAGRFDSQNLVGSGSSRATRRAATAPDRRPTVSMVVRRPDAQRDEARLLPSLDPSRQRMERHASGPAAAS